ncbi:WecB/TagA/CpsF family glycosyltransferase [Dyadobacter psychrotolerans]|uniref:Glycosyltransferase n=1 Tax=Dyadobacter psychrotolerans TaxID=2541721 RepID=A0A4R5D4S8_9BACT|nr:WecB/TagA/CpsF family glycosyltransferase [Dyadobacter psychrotolerans]TDE08412.1 glycosyltransferase [Dyadobacter psychrotolerans]
MLPKIKQRLFSIDITIAPYASFIDRLIEMAVSGVSSYTCVANVHMLVEAYKDSSFAEVVNGADLITPDGVPLTVALKLLNGVRQERVAGMDLLPDLLLESEKKLIPVYFYGGTKDMLIATEQYCLKKYPLLKIAGMYSPPFRPLTENETNTVLNQINESNAKFVFVALGCPKQENWMASMRGRINASMIGIGGALPVMIGTQKRAPKWMQDTGLEWLYRLMQEPRRLFKRYAVTNSVFLFLLFKAYFKPRI